MCIKGINVMINDTEIECAYSPEDLVVLRLAAFEGNKV